MPYWKFLYRAKRDDESDYDKLMRRLSFKLPIVTRFGIGFPLIFGGFHATLFHNKKILKWHIMISPLYFIGLCYQEIEMYQKIRNG